MLLGILLIVTLFTFSVYAGNESTLGVENDSTSASGLEVYGGGATAVSIGIDAIQDQNTMEYPGYIKLWGYAADQTTVTAYYLWIDTQGRIRVSSGSSGTGGVSSYGIPTDTGFSYEASGELIGEQISTPRRTDKNDVVY